MTANETTTAPVEGTPPADARWEVLEHALLAGLTHALSNRAASVAAISSLATPGESWTPRLAGMLDAEAANLQTLVRGLRLLTTDPALGVERIELGPVLTALVELHAHHPDLRDVEVTLGRNGTSEHTEAAPRELVTRVLLDLDAAKRDATTRGGRVVVRYGGDPPVAISVEGG